jgi:CBS domain-containing protein
MKVSDAMTRDVRTMSPGQTIREAAQVMQRLDVGFLPVGENDRLVGMITDRDIAIRGVGAGKGPEARISEIMTADVKYCFEDEDTDHVARNMGMLQIRRLPVVDRNKRLVGVISLGDLAVGRDTGGAAGSALKEISRPKAA